ncbi:MAG: NAD(P)/FAD-dependent oxidoreductase [Paracoccaceae bacterium]
MKQLKVAVVGAGIVGISTAEWLRRDGHHVTLIDRNDPGTPAQTSYGNAGLLAAASIIPVPVPGLLSKAPGMLFSADGPLHLRWSYLPRLLPWLIPFLRRATDAELNRTATSLAEICGDSPDQHMALAKGTGAEAYIRHGPWVALYPSESACRKDDKTHAIRRAHGFRMEEFGFDRLRAEDPHLGEHYVHAASQLDHGWITNPGAYVAQLFTYFRSQGGAFLKAEVDDMRPEGEGASASITAAGETTTYDRLVLAGGAWSGKLAKQLGHDPALESERGYHLLLKNPSHMPPHPYMLTDIKSAVTPMERGLRFAGQVEFGGLDAGPSRAPFKVVKSRIHKLYPDLTWEDEEEWMGHRPSTVDSLPLVGPSPKAPSIHFAFGAQHIGLTSGPKTGRLIADMIGGRTPNIDMAPFRVGRFDRWRGPDSGTDTT